MFAYEHQACKEKNICLSTLVTCCVSDIDCVVWCKVVLSLEYLTEMLVSFGNYYQFFKQPTDSSQLWMFLSSTIDYSRSSRKRPPKMQRLVVAYESRNARAKFLSQPRMAWYIYSKKVMKVYFPLPVTGSFIDIIISHSMWQFIYGNVRHKFGVKKFYLCMWLLVQKCP